MATKIKASLACAILVMVIAGTQAQAWTLDVNPGDPTAFGTIQKAIDAAKNFDTVIVHPWVYGEAIDFKGKAITVKSTDPTDPEVVADTVLQSQYLKPAVAFVRGETNNSVLDGLTVRNGSVGITCQNAASPTIKRCVITSNDGYGIDGGAPVVENCTIQGNRLSGMRLSGGRVANCVVAGNLTVGIEVLGNATLSITNCTVVGNRQMGVFVGYPPATDISSSIIAYNLLWGVYVPFGTNVHVEYSDLYGNGIGPAYNYFGPIANALYISEEPWFADSGNWETDVLWRHGDYHLLSRVGRWDPDAQTWVNDPIDSPCIDEGDPYVPVGAEPQPNGGRINMGAYGGTDEASMSTR